MFHIHIGIIHAKGFWITSVDKDLSVCDIILAFTGPKLFCDTAELEKVVINCDIYFLSSVGDEYLILPSGQVHKVLTETTWKVLNLIH